MQSKLRKGNVREASGREGKGGEGTVRVNEGRVR